MTTEPSDDVDVEVPEGDRLEQQQPAAPDRDRPVSPPATDRALPEGSEADLAEQAIEVPLDEEEDR